MYLVTRICGDTIVSIIFYRVTRIISCKRYVRCISRSQPYYSHTAKERLPTERICKSGSAQLKCGRINERIVYYITTTDYRHCP